MRRQRIPEDGFCGAGLARENGRVTARDGNLPTPEEIDRLRHAALIEAGRLRRQALREFILSIAPLPSGGAAERQSATNDFRAETKAVSAL